MKRDSLTGGLFGYISPVTGDVCNHPPLCICGNCPAPVERFPQPAVVLAEKTPEDWEGRTMKAGRLRGNASGRTFDWRFRKFFCHGCQREHGRHVERTQDLDGKLLCNGQYYKSLDARSAIAARITE